MPFMIFLCLLCKSKNTAYSHCIGAVKRYWRIMDLLLDISKITEKIMDPLDFNLASFEVLFKARSTELLMELYI